MPTAPQTVQLTDLVGSLKRHWPVVVATAVVGLILGVLVSVAWPSRYEATSTVSVNPGSGQPSGSTNDQTTSVSMPTEVGVATSSPVVSAAAKQLKVSADDVREATTVESPDDSFILDITFTADSAARAAAGAEAVADAYLANRTAEATEATADLTTATQAQLAAVQASGNAPENAGSFSQRALGVQADALGAKLAQLGNVDLEPGQVVGSAETPDNPSTPGALSLGLAGLFLGLLAGVPLALTKKEENSDIGGVDGLHAIGDQIVLDGTKDTNRADTWDIAAFMLKIPTDIGIENPFLIMVDAEDEAGRSITPGQELVDALSRRGRSARFVDAGAINEGKISRGWPTDKKRVSWAGEIIVIDTTNTTSDANKVALATRSDSVLLARSTTDDANALRRLAGLLKSKNVDIALTALFPPRPEMMSLSHR